MQDATSVSSTENREARGGFWPLRWARWGATLILLMSIVLPNVLKGLTVVMLAGVIWLIALAVAGKEIAWTQRRLAVGLATVLFSAAGLFWSLYGSSLGAPGAVRVMTVYVIYPPLFFYLGVIFRQGDFKRLVTIFRVATALVIASQVAFVLSWLGVDRGKFASLMVHLYGTLAVVDKASGFTLFTLPNVASLMFLAPFLLTDTLVSGTGRLSSGILFTFSLLACLVAGRRAIYPVLAVSLLSIAFLGRPLLKSNDIGGRAKRGVVVLVLIGLCGLGAALATGALNSREVVSRVMSLQKISSDNEDSPRIKQIRALVGEVSASPILGEGAGAAGSYRRSNSQPWAYELTYVDLLFQFGVAGLLIFCCGFIYLLNCLMRALANVSIDTDERAAVLCFTVGLIAFAVANATNPYLAKFSYMWVLFIPVAAVAAGVDIRRSL